MPLWTNVSGTKQLFSALNWAVWKKWPILPALMTGGGCSTPPGAGLLRPVTFPAACRGSNPSQAEDQGAENSGVWTRPVHPRALLDLDLVFCRSISSSRSLCPSRLLRPFRPLGDPGGVASGGSEGDWRSAVANGKAVRGRGALARRVWTVGQRLRRAGRAAMEGAARWAGTPGPGWEDGTGRLRRPPCAGRAPGPPGPVLGRAPGPRCVGERVGCRARPSPAGAVGGLRGLNPCWAGLRRPPDLPFALQELRGSDTELPREWPAGAVGQVSPPPGSGVGVAAGGTAGL